MSVFILSGQHVQCRIGGKNLGTKRMDDAAGVHLIGGAPGPEIGRLLAWRGCSNVFLAAYPEMVVDSVEGTLGALFKTIEGDAPAGAIEFAVSSTKWISRVAPAALRLFFNPPLFN